MRIHNLRVLCKTAGSPAFENGLLKADRIISINGTKIPDIHMNVIDDLVEGVQSDAIELEIERGKKIFKKRIKTRSLI